MKIAVILGTLAVVALAAAPARADHNALLAPADAPRAEAPRPGGTTTESSVDIDLKLGWNGFRFGSRVFGRDGYAGGAWLNGATRPDGFSLDGRLERDGKAHNFKMNVDVDEWLRRATRLWGLTDL
jgi:hypothetical protein